MGPTIKEMCKGSRLRIEPFARLQACPVCQKVCKLSGKHKSLPDHVAGGFSTFKEFLVVKRFFAHSFWMRRTWIPLTSFDDKLQAFMFIKQQEQHWEFAIMQKLAPGEEPEIGKTTYLGVRKMVWISSDQAKGEQNGQVNR